MDEKTTKILIDLIEGLREITFDVNFCLAILKEDEEIAKFYDKCKKRFDEQKTELRKGEE
jgi:hypothetical protein